ncbi:MAG: DUF1080 domain-containing protein [bacterium]|nr:DUF1080 domain-containing protein [bacterium]
MKKIIPLTFLSVIIWFGGCTRNSTQIFNGKDLSNWHFVVENDAVNGEEVYSVEKGIITVKGDPLGYMYTAEKYRNFTLELEYRWAGEESNSGIFFLIEEPANPFPRGIECQLKAGQAGDLVLLGGSDLNEYQLPEGITERPAFPVIPKKKPSNEKPAGEWNSIRINVEEGTISISVNGLPQNSATSEVKEGHIGLQSEGKAIQFRNLVLQERN